MPIEQVEMNTIVTFLGMLCATVQVVTGFYAAYVRKRTGLLKGNDVLFRAHRAFGGFATTLYLLGLFAGVNGLIGALIRNQPPLELRSPSFNVHTWGSFPVLIVLNFCFDDFPVRMRVQMVERAAEVAASLAFYYANLKQEIGFVTTGTTVTGADAESGLIVVQGKSGFEHAQEILEVIAKLKTVPGRVDFTSMLFRSGSSIAMGTKVMIVTPRVNETQAQGIIAARRKGLNLQVLQLESSQERRDEDHLKGAVRVIPIKEMGQGTINE